MEKKEKAMIEEEKGLVGYWKLKGDCEDYSGEDNHGVNRGVNLEAGEFNGTDSYVEVPNSPSLSFGTGDFSICAWVRTEKDVAGVIGDVLSKYDASRRKGFTFSINASSGGYQSQGDDKHVCFGIDNAKVSEWVDCGRPSETSNYVSNSLTVFDGKLYAAISDAETEEDWCHVYRYEGGQEWADCGRVGDRKTPGVGPLIVHGGKLYAVTWTYDWTRDQSGDYDPSRVYCHEGGQEWKDCGQPGNNVKFNGIASYRGTLYLGGQNKPGRPYTGRENEPSDTCKMFAYEGGKEWPVCAELPAVGPRRCWPRVMAVHHGKLYVSHPAVYSYDGEEWTYVGIPFAVVKGFFQIHALEIYKGELYAGTWPHGKIAMYKGGEDWEDCGAPEGGMEIMALAAHNGKFYAGSLPYGEVSRYEGGQEWTCIKRFLSPPGWDPTVDGIDGPERRKRVNDWTRITSLTVHDGKLFASTGSCTSSRLDAPCDVRGKVFCMEAGKCVSYDHDLGPGWKHIAAVRENGKLKLYVNGQLEVKSAPFDPNDYDVSNGEPLKIGFGELDYFSGKINDVRVYNRALAAAEITRLRRESNGATT